jgi:DNA-binding MarR family transcriptional regulator
VPLSLEQWAGFTVVLVAHALEKRYARALQALGISLRDFVLLAEIDKRPGLSQSVLAERVGLTRSRVSEQLAVLDTAGYVAREMSWLDLRKRRLWITPPGQAVLEEAKACLTAIDAGWLSALDPHTRPHFTAAMRALAPAKAWLQPKRRLAPPGKRQGADGEDEGAEGEDQGAQGEDHHAEGEDHHAEGEGDDAEGAEPADAGGAGAPPAT